MLFGSMVACAGDNNSGQPDPARAKILSAYHGLDALPAMASNLCPMIPITGEDGMPVVFSVQVDAATVTPSGFVVETTDGQQVTPVCATLAPALEPLERRTVLLAGPFGTAAMPPRSITVLDSVFDVNGDPLEGLTTDQITALAAGPRLTLAERFEPQTPGLAGECPDGTLQVVQLTFQGGVTGPLNAPLGEAQRLGVVVTLDDGTSVNPIALADDDPDNHVLACLDVESVAQSVTVESGLFYDPGNDGNPETTADISGE